MRPWRSVSPGIHHRLPPAGLPIEQPFSHRGAEVLGDEKRVAVGMPNQELHQARWRVRQREHVRDERVDRGLS